MMSVDQECPAKVLNLQKLAHIVLAHKPSHHVANAVPETFWVIICTPKVITMLPVAYFSKARTEKNWLLAIAIPIDKRIVDALANNLCIVLSLAPILKAIRWRFELNAKSNVRPSPAFTITRHCNGIDP